MNEEFRVCRRCLLIQSGKIDILADIKERIGKIPIKDKAEESIYKHRLKACGMCDFLEGGTCLKCGCYPEFRAAFAKNKCPIGRWNNMD